MPAGGLDDVLDERADEAGGGRHAGGGAEQVDGAVAAQELLGVEVLAAARRHRVEDLRVGQRRERDGHHRPDRVPLPRVGVDDRVQGLVPGRRGAGVGGEDEDRLAGLDRGQGPPVQVGRDAPGQRGRVQQAADRLLG